MELARTWRLFSRPNQEWQAINREQPPILGFILKHLLFMAAIPPVSLYLGTTMVGWTLPGGSDVTYLTNTSAALIATIMYVSIPVTIGIIAGFIHWMGHTYGVQPNFTRCLTFTAYTATPLLIGGIVGLTPSLWLVTIAIILMIASAARLLFTGLPIVMGISKERGMMFAFSILCVALVILVTAKVITVTLWKLGIGPVYL